MERLPESQFVGERAVSGMRDPDIAMHPVAYEGMAQAAERSPADPLNIENADGRVVGEVSQSVGARARAFANAAVSEEVGAELVGNLREPITDGWVEREGMEDVYERFEQYVLAEIRTWCEGSGRGMSNFMRGSGNFAISFREDFFEGVGLIRDVGQGQRSHPGYEETEEEAVGRGFQNFAIAGHLYSDFVQRVQGGGVSEQEKFFGRRVAWLVRFKNRLENVVREVLLKNVQVEEEMVGAWNQFLNQDMRFAWQAPTEAATARSVTLFVYGKGRNFDEWSLVEGGEFEDDGDGESEIQMAA